MQVNVDKNKDILLNFADMIGTIVLLTALNETIYCLLKTYHSTLWFDHQD